MYGLEEGRGSEHERLNFYFTSNAFFNTYLISLTSPDERRNTTVTTCFFWCIIRHPTYYTMPPFSLRHVLILLILTLILILILILTFMLILTFILLLILISVLTLILILILILILLQALESYDFGDAGRQIYEFLWDEYADWYIELSKARMRVRSCSHTHSRLATMNASAFQHDIFLILFLAYHPIQINSIQFKSSVCLLGGSRYH